jgi:hypothetical protein
MRDKKIDEVSLLMRTILPHFISVYEDHRRKANPYLRLTREPTITYETAGQLFSCGSIIMLHANPKLHQHLNSSCFSDGSIGQDLAENLTKNDLF